MEKIMGKLSDAIDDKWPPAQRNRTVLVQMDNASPHITESNEFWQKKRQGKRQTVRLIRQPPLSTNLNILNLGLWNSIQSRQKKRDIMHTNFELVRGIQEC